VRKYEWPTRKTNKLPVEHFATTTFKTTYYAPPVPYEGVDRRPFLLKTSKKKVLGAFSGKCLRMQKAPIKLAKSCHWDIALGCGPGSHDAQGLAQSELSEMATWSQKWFKASVGT
jgi:hypothetical protein